MTSWVYLIFVLGFASSPWLERYNQLGDYSYGVYIYAFPVQEMLAHIQKGISPLGMIAEAFPLVLIAAVLSWHLIEKPSMSVRHNVAILLRLYLAALKGFWSKRGPVSNKRLLNSTHKKTGTKAGFFMTELTS